MLSKEFINKLISRKELMDYVNYCVGIRKAINDL